MEITDKLLRNVLQQLEEPVAVLLLSDAVDASRKLEKSHLSFANEEFWKFFGLNSNESVLKVIESTCILEGAIGNAIRSDDTVEVELIRKRNKNGTETKIALNSSVSIEDCRCLVWFHTKKDNEDWKFWSQEFPDLMWRTDAEGKSQFLSKNWLDYCGMSEQESIGYGWIRALHPDSDFLRAWEVAISKRLPLFTYEAQFRRYDGTYRWFLVRAIPKYDENHNVTNWYGSCTDIDDAKNAQEVVEKMQRSRFKRLFECDIMGIVITSNDCFIRQANSHFLQLEDIRDEKLNWKNFISLGYNNIESFALDELDEKGFCSPFEIKFTLKGEKEIFVLMGLVGMLNEVVAFFIDITRQKRAENEAIQASAAKSLFVAKVSHEIRTPLNAICGMIELLMDSQLNPQQKDYTRTILKSSDTLRQLIHDVLDFSKMEANKAIVDKSEFSVKFLVEDVVELLGESANAKRIDLMTFVELNGDIVIGDSAKLRQVLVNLIGNAIKFTATGHVAVTAKTLEENEEFEIVSFTIEDSGIGISEENQKHLFQPFFQVNSQIPGTGLGLSISKQLIQLMEGDISVKSTDGAGATFYFTVKFKKSPNVPIEKEISPSNFGQVTALIFQPNDKFREIIESYLDKIGIKHQEISDSQAVLDIVKDLNVEPSHHVILIADGKLHLQCLQQLLNEITKNKRNFKILVTDQGEILQSNLE